MKRDIRALTKTELRDFFVSEGDKAFRGNQVYEWLWSKSAHSFEDMTNISLETREMLEENFVINHMYQELNTFAIYHSKQPNFDINKYYITSIPPKKK